MVVYLVFEYNRVLGCYVNKDDANSVKEQLPNIRRIEPHILK